MPTRKFKFNNKPTNGKIRLIGSPPGSGKSEIRLKLARYLKHLTGERWTAIEHEQVLTPNLRVNAANLGNIAMSDKRFVLEINLPGQLATQALARDLARQGHNVLLFGPFENVYSLVDGTPLYLKMRDEDFADFDFQLIYFLLMPENSALTSVNVMKDPGMLDVEAEIQRRLAARASKSPWQTALDEDKAGKADYYRSRARQVLTSAEKFGFNVVPHRIGESPEELSIRIAKALV